MSLRASSFCVLLLFCGSAPAQEKKQPLPEDMSTLPSLNRTFDQGMEGLADRFKMKKRAPLTPGIDNWWGTDEKQHVGLSLKCVNKTVIAGSIEVPMITKSDEASTERVMTLDKFLVNLCPGQGLDAARNVITFAGVIEQISKDNTQMFKLEVNGILIYAVAMPARKTVQFNVISIEFLKKNYDTEGL